MPVPATPSLPDVPALPPVLEFLRVLWSLNHALESTSSDMLRTYGVTAQQRMVLRIVGSLGPAPAGQLSRVLHVHPGTLSATLARLERRGLVYRARGLADARRVMVSLTEAGATLLAQSEGTVERAAAAALDASSEVVTAHALQLLARLTAELEETRGVRPPLPHAAPEVGDGSSETQTGGAPEDTPGLP